MGIEPIRSCDQGILSFTRNSALRARPITGRTRTAHGTHEVHGMPLGRGPDEDQRHAAMRLRLARVGGYSGTSLGGERGWHVVRTILVILCALVAGCGGDSDDEPSLHG